MPVILPHRLFPWMMQAGFWPKLGENSIRQYWQHLKDVGSPLSSMSDDGCHIPLYLWGDVAQYTESGESMSAFCCGIVVDDNRSNIFPLFLCKEEPRMNYQTLLSWNLQKMKTIFFWVVDVSTIRIWALDLTPCGHFLTQSLGGNSLLQSQTSEATHLKTCQFKSRVVLSSSFQTQLRWWNPSQIYMMGCQQVQVPNRHPWSLWLPRSEEIGNTWWTLVNYLIGLGINSFPKDERNIVIRW